MSAARRSGAKALQAPSRLIDVFLIDRVQAIKAIASGALPIEAVSINLWKIKDWALDTNQLEGEINGFRIEERKV